jgi:predicted metal-dependent HD superfamily phosphohydrolase
MASWSAGAPLIRPGLQRRPARPPPQGRARKKMNALPERVSLEAFAALWRRLGARPDPGPTHTVLCNAYGEPHRHYHTLAHVARVLTVFDGIRHCLRDPSAAEMALWLHDLVYDTHAGDSEAQSAIQARILLRHAGVKPEVITHVADLILATDHAAILEDLDDPDARYVMDADLAILGASDADFLRYERQIREEYHWVPEATYRLRRAAILRRFLERPFIYHTPQFRHLESRARLNLAFALTRLQTPA